MNESTIWTIIAANAAIAIVSAIVMVSNSWFVARYMKRTPMTTAPPAPRIWGALVNAVIVLLALCSLLLSVWSRSPNVTEQILQIGLSIGFLAYGAAAMLVASLREVVRGQGRAIDKLIEGFSLLAAEKEKELARHKGDGAERRGDESGRSR